MRIATGCLYFYVQGSMNSITVQYCTLYRSFTGLLDEFQLLLTGWTSNDKHKHLQEHFQFPVWVSSCCKPAQSPIRLLRTTIQFTVRGGTTDRWGQLYSRLRLTEKVTDKTILPLEGIQWNLQLIEALAFAFPE